MHLFQRVIYIPWWAGSLCFRDAGVFWCKRDFLHVFVAGYFPPHVHHLYHLVVDIQWILKSPRWYWIWKRWGRILCSISLLVSWHRAFIPTQISASIVLAPFLCLNSLGLVGSEIKATRVPKGLHSINREGEGFGGLSRSSDCSKVLTVDQVAQLSVPAAPALALEGALGRDWHFAAPPARVRMEKAGQAQVSSQAWSGGGGGGLSLPLCSFFFLRAADWKLC